MQPTLHHDTNINQCCSHVPFEDQVVPKLTKKDYYTIPSIEELRKLSPPSLTNISNFIIGCKDFGEIRFLGGTNVKGLDLDSIVYFSQNQVIVYPDELNKPEIGKELNKPAIITFLNCYPTCKNTVFKKFNIAKYVNRLKRNCAKSDAKFISYKYEKREWKFRVPHFSRYGLDDSDDEQDNPRANNQAIVNRPTPIVANNKPVQEKIQLPTQEKEVNLPLESLKKARVYTKESPSVTSTETTFDDEKVDDEADSDEESYREESFEEYYESDSFDDMDEDAPPAKLSQMLGLDVDSIGELRSGKKFFEKPTPQPPLSFLPPNYKIQETKSSYVSAKSSLPLSIPSSQVDIPLAPLITQKKIENIVPFERSYSSSENLRSDAGALFGRSFRAGWGPGGKLIFQGSKIGSVSIIKCNESPNKSDKENEALLQNHLKYSIRNQGYILPVYELNPNTVDKNVDENVLTLSSLLHTKSEESKKSETINHMIQTLKLTKCLFGAKASFISNNPDTVLKTRLFQLNKWLQEVTSPTVQKALRIEKSLPENEKYLEEIFIALSGKYIGTAIDIALKKSDIRFAGLIAQAPSRNPQFQKLIASQLDEWVETNSFIHPKRKIIYNILCGNVHSVIGSLDWKRALGMILWYGNKPETLYPNIQDIMDVFEMCILKSQAKKPLPYYKHTDDENEIYDIVYHLLQLFCNRALNLRSVFNSESFTPDHYDYQLMWHLYTTLDSYKYIFSNKTSKEIIPLEYDITMKYIFQLENLGLWEWAIFVILNLSERQECRSLREDAVRDILNRWIPSMTDAKEHFILQIGVPKEWISLSKAFYAHYKFEYIEELNHLIDAGHWRSANDIAMEYIVPNAFLQAFGSFYNAEIDDILKLVEEGNVAYKYMSELLSKLNENKERIDKMAWNTGCGIYFEFLQIVKDLHNNKQSYKESNSIATSNKLKDLSINMSELSKKIPNLNTYNRKIPTKEPNSQQKASAAFLNEFIYLFIQDTESMKNPIKNAISNGGILPLDTAAELECMELPEDTRATMLQGLVSQYLYCQSSL